jgi:hypothetical protein
MSRHMMIVFMHVAAITSRYLAYDMHAAVKYCILIARHGANHPREETAACTSLKA